VTYRTLVVDPPWEQPSGGPANGTGYAVAGGRPSTRPYPTMSLVSLLDLQYDVAAIRDAGHLYLWATNAHIEDACDLARAWGFRPSVLLTWAKTPRGLGLGGTFTQTTEHVLFA
jgi:N6-adenosine-specific RNA methylase IME4